MTLANGSVQTGNNGGLIIPFEKEGNQLHLRVDLMANTLDTTGNADSTGLGVGFFHASTTDGQSPDTGFLGIVVKENGTLAWASSVGANDLAEIVAAVPYEGTFDSNSWNTLEMDWMLTDANAELVGLSFGDSTADYAPLLGNVISSLDLLGFYGIGTSGTGLVDNLVVTYSSSSTSLPEPTSWILLLVGFLFFPRRNRQK